MPGSSVSSLTQDLVHCPSGARWRATGQSPHRPETKSDGKYAAKGQRQQQPWARGQRDRDSSGRGLPGRGAAQAVTRPGEQPDEAQTVWAGGETTPSNTGWSVSLGSFFTGVLLGIMGKNQLHPLLLACSPLGRGISGLGRDWAPLGASVKYCTTALPKLTQDFPFSQAGFELEP